MFRKLFISHATPQDNYFAKWLATKLSLIGYDVWCDTSELKGGEDFWRDIEEAVRNESCKFLFVVTHVSIQKKGVLQELAVADRIRDRGDFIIPILLQEVSPNLFPTEIVRLNAINFYSNWATGFRQLVEKLEIDATPNRRSFEMQQIKDLWSSSGVGIASATTNKTEHYWSNWFPCELPRQIYLHKVTSAFGQAGTLKYPFHQVNDWIATFASAECVQLQSSIVQTIDVPIDHFLSNKAFETFSEQLVIKDTNNKVIELLNTAFEQYLIGAGLLTYSMAHGDIAYFPKVLTNKVSTTRVRLDKYGLTHVSLTGEIGAYRWHFGIQGRVFLHPRPIIWMSHHIVFTSDGIAVDSTVQHRLRRKLGSNWYNKQWRDRMLASVLLLVETGTDEKLNVPVGGSQMFNVDVAPLQFVSPIGYLEPM